MSNQVKTERVTETQTHEAINIILSDTPKYTTSLNYAVNYSRAAQMMSGHELAVQCLYILSNITGWRHPSAKTVRETLKKFAKENTSYCY